MHLASVVLKASNTNFLIVGTYQPFGSSDDALPCRNKLQEQIESLLSSLSNCTPLIVGGMNATAYNNERASGAMYTSDRSNRSFLSSNNLPSCTEQHQTLEPLPRNEKKQQQKKSYTFSRADDIILPTDLAMQCPSCHTCKQGYLSVHIHLLVTLPIKTLKIHIPILNDIHPPQNLLLMKFQIPYQ